MSTDVAHKSWWQIFEVVFGIPFLAAIALQLAVPLSLPRTFLTPAIVLAGAALIIVGVLSSSLRVANLRSMASRPTQDLPQASSLPAVFSLSQGIPSTSAAFAFW